jgi:DNA-binding PadR family transcriptional regulator
MADPQALILLTLSGGAKHGYAIQQEIARRANVRLGPGTLYGAIARLEDAGHIVGEDGEERRRPYRITPSGRAHLSSRLTHARTIVSWAKSVGAR